MSAQGEFDFASRPGDGYAHWQAERQRAAEEQARRLGLPLGHPVEVWLRGNIRLRGKLRLQEESLYLDEDPRRPMKLQVDGVSFDIGEMESCVRTD